MLENGEEYIKMHGDRSHTGGKAQNEGHNWQREGVQNRDRNANMVKKGKGGPEREETNKDLETEVLKAAREVSR